MEQQQHVAEGQWSSLIPQSQVPGTVLGAVIREQTKDKMCPMTFRCGGP